MIHTIIFRRAFCNVYFSLGYIAGMLGAMGQMRSWCAILNAYLSAPAGLMHASKSKAVAQC